jgi:hypothetical protein
MSIGDFVTGALHDAGKVVTGSVGAVENLQKSTTKVGGFALDPHHWDDIAKGAYHAEQFVQHHPSETFQIAKAVGTHMAKDFVKPQNLLLTAGLVAATVATGGIAGGAALAAEGSEVAAGVAGATEGISAAVKSADAVSEGAEAVSEGVNTAQKLGRWGNFVQDVSKTSQGIREAQGMQKLDAGLNAVTEYKGAAREALGLTRYGLVNTARAWAGRQILGEAGAEGAGAISRTVANTVAGGVGNSAWEMPGEANAVRNVAQMKYRWGQVQTAIHAPQIYAAKLHTVATGVEFAADPEGTAIKMGEQFATKNPAKVQSWASKALGSNLTGLAPNNGLTPEKQLATPQASAVSRVSPSSTWTPGNYTPTSMRSSSRSAPTGTTTTVSSGFEMPQVGPSNWYGPQNGYSAGRGFASQDSGSDLQSSYAKAGF